MISLSYSSPFLHCKVKYKGGILLFPLEAHDPETKRIVSQTKSRI